MKELGKAIKAAQKRIRTLGDKQLNQNLDYFCGSYAEAFRAGVEEAQGEIVSRLRSLEAKLQRADSNTHLVQP